MSLCLRLIHVWDTNDKEVAPVNEAVTETMRRATEFICELVMTANTYNVPVHVINGNKNITHGWLKSLLDRSCQAHDAVYDDVVYAGFSADFSLGTYPEFGFLESKGRAHVVPTATSVLHIDARSPVWKQKLAELYPEWSDVKRARGTELPWKSRDELEAETDRFCSMYDGTHFDCISAEEFERMCQAEWKKRAEQATFTLVSVPLPFTGFRDQVQKNALGSWTRLNPRPHIILLGDEDGVEKAACEFGCQHVPDLPHNEHGISMQGVFSVIDRRTLHDLIAYVDTDVILMSEFSRVIQYVDEQYSGQFLLGGGRWSARGISLVDFSDPGWEQEVWGHVFRNHNKGSDYAVYRRGFFHDMPDFTIGCGWWDGWRMGYAKKNGWLVNGQRVIRAVHQDHGLRRPGSPCWGRNKQLMGGCQAWVYNADDYLDPGKMRLPELKIDPKNIS